MSDKPVISGFHELTTHDHSKFSISQIHTIHAALRQYRSELIAAQDAVSETVLSKIESHIFDTGGDPHQLTATQLLSITIRKPNSLSVPPPGLIRCDGPLKLQASGFYSIGNTIHVKSDFQIFHHSDINTPVYSRTINTPVSKHLVSDSILDDLPAGTYYWRTRYHDNAGNVSAWSENAPIILVGDKYLDPVVSAPIQNAAIQRNLVGDTLCVSLQPSKTQHEREEFVSANRPTCIQVSLQHKDNNAEWITNSTVSKTILKGMYDTLYTINIPIATTILNKPAGTTHALRLQVCFVCPDTYQETKIAESNLVSIEFTFTV